MSEWVPSKVFEKETVCLVCKSECTLCSYPWRWQRDTLAKSQIKWFSIQEPRRCSLLILLFHGTLSKKVTVNRFPWLFSMGHHLLPAPLNFPVPGHQVRHSQLVAVERLPPSHLVGVAMTSHGASEKGQKVAQTANNVWAGSLQPIREDVSAAAPLLDGHHFGLGRGGWWGLLKERGARSEEMTASCTGDMTGWQAVWWFVCVCAFGGNRVEITPAEVGEAAVPSVICRDWGPHGCRVAQCPAAVHPLIHNILYQLMGLRKCCPRKAPRPHRPRGYEIRCCVIFSVDVRAKERRSSPYSS